MSTVTRYGHGIWCYTCQAVYEDTGDCEHGLGDKAGIQKGRDGNYFAQPDDMGHFSPHMFHEIDGMEQCVECGRVKIPADLVEDDEKLVTDGGDQDVQGTPQDAEEPDYDRFHADVCEIADHFEPESFGTIVYDPPFSQNQANRSYDLDDGEAVVAGNDAVAKREFHDLLQPGGRVIQFGYTTTCMPGALGYERREVAVWNTLGRCNDYLSVIDEKPGELEAGPRWFR